MGNLLSTLNSLIDKVTEIDITINHDSDGIQTRLTTAQEQADANLTTLQGYGMKYTATMSKVDNNAQEIQNLKAENAVLKGIIHKQSNQLQVMNEKIAMLTAKSMERKVTISGLPEASQKKENCKQSVVTFLKEKVEIDVEEHEIYVAHRIGKYSHTADGPRLMLARCSTGLKERIFKNVSNLKDKTDHKGKAYYINKQLPDQIMEKTMKYIK